MALKLESINIHAFEFVDELPPETICGICQFILKDPMQNSDCGHCFCDASFDDLKEHSCNK